MKKVWLAAFLVGGAALAARVCAAPPLAIHIAATPPPRMEKSGMQRLALIGPAAQFAVVLTNLSAHPLRIWKAGCSWGYYALFFEVHDTRGIHRLSQKPVAFLKNFPQFLTLAPGESVRRYVALASGDWVGFPVPAPGHSLTLTMRAVFETKPDAESQRYQVWNGRVATSFARYTLERDAE